MLLMENLLLLGGRTDLLLTLMLILVILTRVVGCIETLILVLTIGTRMETRFLWTYGRVFRVLGGVNRTCRTSAEHKVQQ
tara:strand:- start:253 stop:492 length:240 start_codon:yes stop_codon:yes gene_type:complete